jgi:ketosteroid isomerase-like protein
MMIVSKEQNLAVKQQFVAAVFAGDKDTLRRLADPHFELHEGSAMPFVGTYRGAEGFIGFLDIFMAAFDIRRLEETGAYTSEDPDQMVFTFELEAVYRPTGVDFSSSLIEAWQFSNGKVLKIVAHYLNSPLHPLPKP